MSNFHQLGQPVRVGHVAGDPSSPLNGLIFYDSVAGRMKSYASGSFDFFVNQTELDSAIASAIVTAFSDADFQIYNDVDDSKILAFDVSGISAATTRTISMPDSDVNLEEVLDLRALSGTALGAVDYGTFTGTILSDNETTKTLFQELETEVELKAYDADVIKKDGSVAFTGDQSMGGFKLTNLADPVSNGDAVSLGYLNLFANGFKPKAAVRVLGEADVDIATELENGDTLDGVTLVTGDRVLLVGQVDLSENGIYVVAASGAASRSADFDEVSPIDEINKSWVAIQEGTHAGEVYVQYGTVNTVGTDDITFTYKESVADLVEGDAIAIAGSTISVKYDDITIGINGSNELEVKDAGITDAKVATGIDAAKIADGSVSNTEFQYLDGVTSSIQTQLDAKLENVVEDTTPELGGNLEVNTFAIESAANPVVIAGQNSMRRAKQASKANFVEEEYLHTVSLAASQTNTVIASLGFAHATFEGIEITYKLKEATSNDIRIGTIRVVTNGTAVSYTDSFNETADTGITFDAVVNGANIDVRYSSGTNGATMRADIKRFLV